MDPELSKLEALAEANPEVIILKAAGGTVTGGSSSQPAADPDFGTPNEALTPPASLEQLMTLTQSSATRGAIIDAIALNTVGLGYALAPAEGHESDITDAKGVARQLRERLETLARRDTRLEHPSFTELLVAIKNDEEGCGNAYVEVSRDRRTGEISGLFHCPGHRVRRLKDRDGYVLSPPSGDWANGVKFYNFGDKVQYDSNGKPTNKLNGTGKRWERNELIAFKLYTSESRDYGLPRDAAIVGDLLGDRLAAEANIGFFDSSGVAPTIIFVQGEETKAGGKVTFRVPDETVRRIADTLKPEAGRATRVAIIPVPPGTKTEQHDLAQRSERDIGFTEFRADNRQRHLTAFRMQPLLVAISDDGRYDAEVQRAMTLEQVFDPEQNRYEDRLRYTLLRDLGFPEWTIKFKRMAVEGDSVRRESTERGAEVGVVTRGEFREAHGMHALVEASRSEQTIEWNGGTYHSEEPDPGQVPFGWNAELIPATGPPAGAENRVNAAEDQRGLKPGLAGRQNRDKSTGHPRHVEDAVQALNGSLTETGRASVGRALARARPGR